MKETSLTVTRTDQNISQSAHQKKYFQKNIQSYLQWRGKKFKNKVEVH